MPSTTRTTRSAASQPPLVQLGDDGKSAVVESGSEGSESEGEEVDDSEQEDGEDEDEDEDGSDDSDEEEEDEDDDANESEEEEPDQTSPLPSLDSTTKPHASSSSTHLDPSLFQTYFSSAPRSILKAPSTPTPLTPAEELAASRERKRLRRELRLRAERKGGIVRGRDGQPMKRLKDGRTIVRALSGNSTEEQDDMDRLARKKSDGYKKRKLGLEGRGGASSIAKPTSTKTTEDDPLGLNDPAFLPGGEFAHLANLTGPRRRKRSKSGATTTEKKHAHRVESVALPRRSAQGGRPAFGFRRGA